MGAGERMTYISLRQFNINVILSILLTIPPSRSRSMANYESTREKTSCVEG